MGRERVGEEGEGEKESGCGGRREGNGGVREESEGEREMETDEKEGRRSYPILSSPHSSSSTMSDVTQIHSTEDEGNYLASPRAQLSA